ncbi:MAG: hypothetical protein ACR2HH_04935 [Chthoniobacterales bacterium]
MQRIPKGFKKCHVTERFAVVEGFSIQLVDADHLHLQFQFTFGGDPEKKATEDIVLQRLPGKAEYA